MGRQHQGMDRPGVWQVPEGNGEQGKMEKTGCKIICGAPTTLEVKGLMMMVVVVLIFFFGNIFFPTFFFSSNFSSFVWCHVGSVFTNEKRKKAGL